MEGAVKEMSPREAHAAWEAGEVAIVDVRESDEHATTHVPGVPLVPMSELGDRLEELPTDRPLVILCRSGRRSAHVADQLNALGEHGDVANLTGGILAWAEDGLPYAGEPPR